MSPALVGIFVNALAVALCVMAVTCNGRRK